VQRGEPFLCRAFYNGDVTRNKKRKSTSARGTGAARLRRASAAKQIAQADFPTRWGHFLLFGFEAKGETAVALVMGEVSGDAVSDKDGGSDVAHKAAPLVRIHSQCLTGDVFGSLRCDCRQQLEMALDEIAKDGRGVLIYEPQEGRGIGLAAKLKAYELQDQGLDTVEANERLGFKADLRGYELPGAVLKALGVRAVRLLSNNPQKVAALGKAGIKVVRRVPCEPPAHARSANYLKTKREKMGHVLSR
jgi:GTP cyclohydrolase II